MMLLRTPFCPSNCVFNKEPLMSSGHACSYSPKTALEKCVKPTYLNKNQII